MHAAPILPAPHSPASQTLPCPAQSAVSTDSCTHASTWRTAPPQSRRHRPNAGDRPVWSEGRGPNPAPPYLIRWHNVDGATRHDHAATSAEALALASDARDATAAETAVYRLWSVLPE